MTDSSNVDMMVTTADNPYKITPPAAKEGRTPRAVMLTVERGETVWSPDVYALMVVTKTAEANQQQLRKRVSNGRLQIKTITSFSHPPAAIIEHAKRLNVDLIIMSSHDRSCIRQQFYGNVAERVLCGAACAMLIIRDQESIHKKGLVSMKEV